MPVGLKTPQNIASIKGIQLSTASSGIRYQGRDDLTLVQIAEHSTVAAVFTQNKFRAAPVNLCVNHLNNSKPRYLIINAGNANAGTGKQGDIAAHEIAKSVAQITNVKTEQVLTFSTGVIGELLDAKKICDQLPAMYAQLQHDQWLPAAHAIMTTDTMAKAYSETVSLMQGECTVTGIAKGSGMIQPNMATMLSFIATDMQIEQHTLQELLTECTEASFNSITVDGDTSTNDSTVLIATGQSAIAYKTLSKADKTSYQQALNKVMQNLAQAIIRDGEGASKFITIDVQQASTLQQAKAVASSVANSPLVKTALAASDPNWGRIMAAVGNARYEHLDLSHAQLSINDVLVWDKDQISSQYNEELGQKIMAKEEIKLEISLGLGSSSTTVWTTDLTHEYIRINAEYRT